MHAQRSPQTEPRRTFTLTRGAPVTPHQLAAWRRLWDILLADEPPTPPTALHTSDRPDRRAA